MRLCRFINDLKAAPRILLITESLVPDFRPRIGRCCAAAWSCEPVLPVCIDGERHFPPQFSMSSLLTVDSDLRFPGRTMSPTSGVRRAALSLKAFLPQCRLLLRKGSRSLAVQWMWSHLSTDPRFFADRSE